MEHSVIDDDNWVERYLLGRLEAADREAFEDHYLDCARCQERLETAGRLRDGLRVVAAEETVKVAVAGGLSRAVVQHRFRRWRSAAVLSILLISAALIFGWQKLGEGAARARLATLENERASLTQQIAALSVPRVLAAPISLVATRGADEPPAMVLDRAGLDDIVILEIDLGASPSTSSLGSLRWRRGEVTVWQQEGHELGIGSDRSHVLSLQVPVQSLEAGDQTIEWLNADGAVERVWSFRVR